MRGMNQVDLAKASGVAQNTISEIELGKREARPGTLKKLADVLGVEIADLFEESGSGKAQRRSSLEPSFNDVLEEQRRSPVLAKAMTATAAEWLRAVADSDTDLDAAFGIVKAAGDLDSTLSVLLGDQESS